MEYYNTSGLDIITWFIGRNTDSAFAIMNNGRLDEIAECQSSIEDAMEWYKYSHHFTWM